MAAKQEIREMAVVTGGAVRLGREIALGLAKAGYAIGLHYHNSHEEAQSTAREIEEHGVQVFLLQADLCNPEEISRIFAQVEGMPFKLSVLINSAAIMTRGNLRTLIVDDWDATLNLNLRAPWLCAQEAARLMEVSGGVIINLSDSGAGKTWSGFPAYTVSKAGVEVLTRLLARTLAPKIRVNAVAPGLIMQSVDSSPDQWQNLVKKLPANRDGNPQDVVRAVLFLIENQYITGEILHVDGGYQIV